MMCSTIRLSLKFGRRLLLRRYVATRPLTWILAMKVGKGLGKNGRHFRNKRLKLRHIGGSASQFEFVC